MVRSRWLSYPDLQSRPEVWRASATVTSPASQAFDISICCKDPAIRKRRYSSHIPPGTARRLSKRGRTRKPFAPPMPVRDSSGDSTSGHRISRALRRSSSGARN
jgi:hypothetical protein